MPNTQVDPFLIPTRITAVFQRGERGHLIKQLLKGLHIELHVFQSIFEAQQHLQHNLAHLVIGDFQVSDGSLADLKTKLSLFPVLAKVPIFGIQLGREAEVQSRDGIEIVYWQSLDKDHLLRLVLGVHKTQFNISPFARTPAQLTNSTKAAERVAITCPVTVLGRVNDLLVFRSQIRVDSSLPVTMIPEDRKLQPAAMNSGSNTTYQNMVYNTYPVRKTQGIGLKWLMEIPELRYSGQPEKGSVRTILSYGSDRENLKQWQKILSGFQLQLVIADSPQHLVTELGNNLKRYAMILLSSELEGEFSKSLLETMDSIPEAMRPNILVISGGVKATPKPYIRFIAKPFGLGEFLDAIESAIPKPAELAQVNADGNVDGAGIHANYQLAGSIICFDECGGALHTSAAPQIGAELKIRSEPLKAYIEESAKIIVSNVRFEPLTRMYHVRFEYTHSGQTPAKRFENLTNSSKPSHTTKV